MNKNLAATAADFQAILTNELGNLIKKSVLFYIDGREGGAMASSFEKEMIAEKAWEKVVEKAGFFEPTGQAKFRTWAKKVALNLASDEMDKLRRDPLHLTSSLCGEIAKADPHDDSDDDLFKQHVCSYQCASTPDCSNSLYWKDAVETLKVITTGYDGRDRTVAEMLLEGRSKEEIMAETQMSSGSYNTCISRLRSRMRSDMRAAGFDFAA